MVRDSDSKSRTILGVSRYLGVSRWTGKQEIRGGGSMSILLSDLRGGADIRISPFGQGKGGFRVRPEGGRCLPLISGRAGAGVGRGMARELAVEFRKQRDAVGEAKLGAGRGERGILRRRRAVDSSADKFTQSAQG